MVLYPLYSYKIMTYFQRDNFLIEPKFLVDLFIKIGQLK